MAIRVKKELKAMSEINPTRQSQLLTISQINDMIDLKYLALPLYQRDVSWTIKQSVDLLNFEILGKAAVSPLSFNEVNRFEKNVLLVTFIERELISSEEYNNVKLSVVDGQQRITTNYKAYIDHEDFKNIVLDLTKGRFIEITDLIKEGQIPVGKLFNRSMDVFNSACGSFDRNIYNLLVTLRTKFSQYNYTINIASKLNEHEQIEWFEVLNNAGSKVSIVQMRFAKLKIHGFDIYEYTKAYKAAIIKANAGNKELFKPQKTHVSYPVAALNAAMEVLTERKHESHYAPIPSDTKENQLCELGAEKLKECCDLTLDALGYTLKFIKGHNLTTPDRIDHVNYLLGFFVFHGKNLSQADEAKLVEWYKHTDFTNKTNSERREIYRKLLLRQY